MIFFLKSLFFPIQGVTACNKIAVGKNGTKFDNDLQFLPQLSQSNFGFSLSSKPSSGQIGANSRRPLPKQFHPCLQFPGLSRKRQDSCQQKVRKCQHSSNCLEKRLKTCWKDYHNRLRQSLWIVFRIVSFRL